MGQPDCNCYANIGISGKIVAGEVSSSDRVVFTSVLDDSVGGDSNEDNTATTPAAGDWRMIAITGGTLELHHADVRYGGLALRPFTFFNPDAYRMLDNQGGEVIFDDADISYAYGNASYRQLYTGTTTVSNSFFHDSPVATEFYAGGAQTITGMKFATTAIAVYFHSGTLTVSGSSFNNTTYGVYNVSPTDQVDARNNFWGSASGPTNLANPTGTGAIAQGNVLFDPWLEQEPGNIPVEPTCLVDCNSSILFLPGIESSRLYRPDYSGGVDQLWEPNTPSDVKDLFLDTNGNGLRDDVYTKDVIDEANIIFPRPNVYLSFLSDLDKWKTNEKLIADYAVAPYDWRLSMDDVINNGNQFPDGRIYYSGTDSATTSPFIIQELRRLAASSHTHKVTIIAHSNGGLVAKALINKLGSEAGNLVDKVIFVAVPQLGTPQAVGALLHGYDQGIPKDWLPAFLDPATARAFASTSPMAYQLLPSQDYFHSEGIDTITPIVTFDDGVSTQQFVNAYGHSVGNYTELHDFLLGNEGRIQPTFSDIPNPSILKSNLLSYGENLHLQIDDNWAPTSSIKLFQIAGFGNETVSGVRYWTGKKCVKSSSGQGCISYIPSIEYTPLNVIDGDGTVIMTSALAMSTSSPNVSRWWVDLDSYNNSIISGSQFRLDTKHADILGIPELREFIVNNIIRSETENLPSFLFSEIPPSNDTKRLSFFLHSPLSLSIRDSLGGVIDQSTTTIKGGSFVSFGEVQYISVLASSSQTLVLEGRESGSFTLEIQEKLGNITVASTTFMAIPCSTSSRVFMDFTDGTIGNASQLQVDENGDGSIDFTLTPRLGEVVSAKLEDINSPSTIVSTTSTLGTNGWYTSNAIVSLTATDTESGVATTPYSLNRGVTWIAYSSPLSITTEGTTTILYYSVDKAGNSEVTNTLTLKIDKTAPEASISVSTSTQDILVAGSDNFGTTTVAKDSSGNVTLTDQAGHTTKLFFTKTYSGKQLAYAKLTGVQYDSQPKVTLPSSSFLYIWDNKIPTTLLSQTIAVDGTYLIQATYDKIKNKTTIIVLKKSLPIQTQVFTGLKVVKLTTNKGVVGYSW
jgi:pimeloyl-ACP methyl ester carboxylesterase